MNKTAQGELKRKVVARVSQGTREMARGPNGEVLSILQEFEDLKDQKRDLEQQLGRFSKAAMLKEQQRIRGKFTRNSQSSLDNWINRKAELEAERRLIVDKKIQIEKRMNAIKTEAKRQKQLLASAADPQLMLKQNQNELLNQILLELKSINDNLRTRNS